MAVNAISSNNIQATPPVRQQEAKPATDRPAEKQATAPAPAPATTPSVNTSGQTTGTRINTSA